MARMLCNLLIFTQLALLPGCRLFSRSDILPEDPHENRLKDDAQPIHPTGRDEKAKKQTMSTAVLREEDKLPTVKLPAGPPHEVASSRPASSDGKKNEGITGIVTLEPGLEPAATKPVGFQAAPQPLPVLDKSAEFEPVVLALQRMLEGRHQDAIKYLGAYEDTKQEVLLRFLPILSTFVKKRVEDLTTQEVAVVMKQLDAMVDELRPRSELIISKACYCRDVHSFASYNPLPDNHAFLTGTENRIGELVQLYVEFKNVTSTATKDREYITHLGCSLELHDAAGKKVWSDGNKTTLRRRARMNDFYSRYGFYVPAIPAGTYKLTIRVTDETNPQHRRIAERSLVFQATPVAN